jgi:hypothetical protein
VTKRVGQMHIGRSDNARNQHAMASIQRPNAILFDIDPGTRNGIHRITQARPVYMIRYSAQYAITGFNMAVCVRMTGKERHMRRRTWPIVNRLWEVTCRGATHLGDWVGQACKPARSAQRRAHARRKTTTAISRHHRRDSTPCLP